MPTFSASDFIGKTLYANKKLNAYVTPPKSGDERPLVVIQPGQMIGVVDTWVGGKEGEDLYWGFIRPGRKKGEVGAMYYVKHGNQIDSRTLQDQGLKSTSQKAKDKKEADQSTSDKIFSMIQKGAMYGGLIWLASSLYKNRK